MFALGHPLTADVLYGQFLSIKPSANENNNERKTTQEIGA